MGLIYYITQVQFDFGALRSRARSARQRHLRPLICTTAVSPPPACSTDSRDALETCRLRCTTARHRIPPRLP